MLAHGNGFTTPLLYHTAVSIYLLSLMVSPAEDQCSLRQMVALCGWCDLNDSTLETTSASAAVRVLRTALILVCGAMDWDCS